MITWDQGDGCEIESGQLSIMTLLIQLLLDWYQDDTENKQQIIRDQSTKCPRGKDDAERICVVMFTDDG